MYLIYKITYIKFHIKYKCTTKKYVYSKSLNYKNIQWKIIMIQYSTSDFSFKFPFWIVYIQNLLLFCQYA